MRKGRWTDWDISVRETIRLNGEGARGLAKSRIAVRDRATAEVIGTTSGAGHLGAKGSYTEPGLRR